VIAITVAVPVPVKIDICWFLRGDTYRSLIGTVVNSIHNVTHWSSL